MTRMMVPIVFLGGLAAGLVSAQTVPSAADTAGHALIEANCATCHGSDQVFAARKTREDWSATLDTMQGYGADFSKEDRERILAYLGGHNAP